MELKSVKSNVIYFQDKKKDWNWPFVRSNINDSSNLSDKFIIVPREGSRANCSYSITKIIVIVNAFFVLNEYLFEEGIKKLTQPSLKSASMTLFTPKGFTSLNLYKCHQLGWMGLCLYNETALYKGHSYVKGVVKDLLHGKHPLLEKFEGGNEKGALIVTT